MSKDSKDLQEMKFARSFLSNLRNLDKILSKKVVIVVSEIKKGDISEVF